MPAVAHLPLVRAAADATSKSNGSGSFVLIAIVVVVLVFMVVSGRRRAKRAQEQQEELAVGSRVVTRAGLIATLVDRSDDEVVLEIAPGVRARFVPQAIGRVLPSDEPTADAATDPAVEPGALGEVDLQKRSGHADGPGAADQGRLAD